MEAGLLRRDALLMQSCWRILLSKEMDHAPLRWEEFAVRTVLAGAFVTWVSALSCGRQANS